MLTVFYSNRVYTLTLLEHSYNAFKTYNNTNSQSCFIPSLYTIISFLYPLHNIVIWLSPPYFINSHHHGYFILRTQS